MKPLNLLLLLLYARVLAYDIKLRVVDETGVTVAGAAVSVLFVNYDGSSVRRGTSGVGGDYATSGTGNNSVMVRVEKSGYYPVQLENLSKGEDHDVEVILPKIIKPIPLYALRIDSSRIHADEDIVFPIKNQWIGFDLEAADWVEPHGKGKTADFLLRFRNEFKGWMDSVASNVDVLMAESRELAKLRKEEWTMDKFKMRAGKWDGLVEMSFPGEGEGILQERRFLSYSPMKLPHVAPEDGYSPNWIREVNNYRSMVMEADAGFFLRTRVKWDKQGRIVSANYAKFIGRLDVRAYNGRLEFMYYFNPTPNDRNLEFDPKRNLFPKGKHGTNVYDP
jgi:hypothetical protein